jgi:hypothetical protein
VFLDWCREHYAEIFERTEFRTWNHLNGLITYINLNGHDNIEAKIVNEAVKRGMLPSIKEYRRLEG